MFKASLCSRRHGCKHIGVRVPRKRAQVLVSCSNRTQPSQQAPSPPSQRAPPGPKPPAPAAPTVQGAPQGSAPAPVAPFANAPRAAPVRRQKQRVGEGMGRDARPSRAPLPGRGGYMGGRSNNARPEPGQGGRMPSYDQGDQAQPGTGRGLGPLPGPGQGMRAPGMLGGRGGRPLGRSGMPGRGEGGAMWGGRSREDFEFKKTPAQIEAKRAADMAALDGLVINDMIPAAEVRVLDSRKEMVGVMPLDEAILLAEDFKQDVILINGKADPPLVRLCSVSKYRYEIEKEKKTASKKRRETRQDMKELKLSPRTDVHDLQVRARKAHKEISKGNKIRLVINFKGREHQTMIPIAEELAEQLFEHVKDIATWETKPAMQGRNMVAFIAPKRAEV